MDTTVPRIRVDSDGICNFCHFHDQLEGEYPQGELGNRRLEHIYDRVRAQGRQRKYDCIVGVSGGRDSTYLLRHLSKEVGLRCLAVHFNDGFGNPTAGHNIRKAAQRLNVDIRTVSADWRESKDLKLSCLKASTPDLNLATDIGLTAALYGVVVSEKIKTIFVGQSFRTEGIAPLEWNYLDGRYLHAIQKKFGTIPLRPWKSDDPGFHLDWHHLFFYSVIKRISVITPFYYMDYVRSDVDKILKDELDWVNPGAHYYDDLYQSLLTYVLRTKFKIDRRIFNYSALIRSGQMSRQDGLDRVKEIYMVEDPKVIDLCIKRLGLTTESLEAMIDTLPKTFRDYPNLLNTIRIFSPFVAVLAKLHIIPKSTYSKYCGGMI